MSPQALLALMVALAACGRERPSEPVAAYSREGRDTVGVLRAFASAINEINARADGARAAPDYPSNCGRTGLACWRIETAHWIVSTGDQATMMLADLLGVRAATRSLGGPPPPCPWPSAAPGSGYRTAVLVRFTDPDLAQVALSRTCDNPPGFLHDIFVSGETFDVRSANGAWEADITDASIT